MLVFFFFFRNWVPREGEAWQTAAAPQSSRVRELGQSLHHGGSMRIPQAINQGKPHSSSPQLTRKMGFCNPWTSSTHQCTIHWMPVITRLWMNFN